MAVLVAGQNIGAVGFDVAAIQLAHDAAGLAQDDDPGGDIPGGKAPIQKAVEAAAGHLGEVERGGAPAAKPG